MPLVSLLLTAQGTRAPSPLASQGGQTLPTVSPATTSSTAELSQHLATLVSPGVACPFPLLLPPQSRAEPTELKEFPDDRGLAPSVSSLSRSLAPPVRPGQTDQNGTARFYSSNLLRPHEAAARPPCSAETVPGHPDHCPAPAAQPQVLTNCWMLKFMVPPLFRPLVRGAAQLNPFIVEPVGGGRRARQRPGPGPDNSVAL